jgi:hypothetical protein
MKEDTMNGTLDATNGTAAPAVTANQAQAFLAAIERLAQLWQHGVLSDEEFQAAKVKLLGMKFEAEPVFWLPEDAVIPLD